MLFFFSACVVVFGDTAGDVLCSRDKKLLDKEEKKYYICGVVFKKRGE